MKRAFLIFTALLIAAGALSGAYADNKAEKPFEITAKVDKDEVNVGDRIKLYVAAEGASGYEVSFPETPDMLGDFSFIGSRPIRPGFGKTSEPGREYELSVYATGAHVIPPVQVRYRKPGEDRWHVLESPQVPVEVKSLLTGEDTDIRDVKGPVTFGPGLSRIALILMVMFIAGAAGRALWIRKKKRAYPGAAEPRSAYEIAHEQLKQLKGMDLPGQGRVKEYYVRLSDIVRHYLENRFSFRAPEMTTEEFMTAMKDSPEMLNEHKDLLKDFLFHCDMVKFAKYGPTPLEILDSFRSAEHLLEQTRLDEEEEGE